ncbi:MAG TPA: hypothetical protein VJV78_41855 [Polyangiales bacterium]|nr:hypothetical protein [Polyangiales bacterium]
MPDEKVDAYMDAVIEVFHPGKFHVRDALAAIDKKLPAGIDGQLYRLLALRRYLQKGGAMLVANWPWTTAEQKTTYRGVIADLRKAAKLVKSNFEDANPGLTLRYTEARDLERQAQLWVDNETVKTAGAALLAMTRRELAGSSYIPNPGAEAAERFRTYLKGTYLTTDPTNAAPGLSDHGKMQAIDFYVLQGKKTIASIRTKTIQREWLNTGLAVKLKDATKGTPLIGPLRKPYEPWHYSILAGGGGPTPNPPPVPID